MSCSITSCNLASVQVSGFRPSDLPGLVGWYKSYGAGNLYTDAGMTTEAVNDGDLIWTWRDLSGLGHPLVQATAAKRPILKLNIRNGNPVVRFDGVSTFMKTTYTLAQPHTRFFALDSTNAANSNVILV
jgi:hypothetical protein